MDEKLWFKAKRYGYGWYPATKEGWLVLVGFLALLLVPIACLMVYGQDLSDATVVLLLIPYEAILVAILITICVKKGEKARWRWGS